MAQLWWIVGPLMILLLAIVTCYTSYMLSICYRIGSLINHPYMFAIRLYLDRLNVKICGIILYIYMFGIAIGYTIAFALSMKAIVMSSCFHAGGRKDDCKLSSTLYMMAFVVLQVF
ncbi:hypothetical protein Leryth_018239 [Lithospermum erythrorhizon]|nr:hypothetical protein Leryth_018239 [Lithospermum erythrorhizon]